MRLWRTRFGNTISTRPVTQSQVLDYLYVGNVTPTSSMQTINNQKLLGTNTSSCISLSGVGVIRPTLGLDRNERVAALFTKDYICPGKVSGHRLSDPKVHLER